MKEKQQLSVSAIKDGTVIDHIPAGNLFKVISMLNLNKVDSMITFGTGFESKKLGRKGIVKLSNVFFKNEDINKIALVAPKAKLNIIRDYEVVDKMEVEVPDTLTGIIKCMNPKCITNNESVVTKFDVVKKEQVKLKCRYCEKITNQENFILVQE